MISFLISACKVVLVQPFNTTITQSTVVQSIENQSNANYWLIAYLSGALFFFTRFILQHFKLYRLRKRSNSISVDSLKVYQIEKGTASFSFFNQIYVSSTMSSTIELKTVVAHEKVHINERHWADLLLLEVVRAIQWFNPLLQLYRKAMMQNHEYLADIGTIELGVSAHTYKAILANQMLGALANYVKQKTAKYKLKGIAYATFTINAKGQITDVRNIRADNAELIKPTETIVWGMGTWKPGHQRGKPVKVDYDVTIEF